MELLKKPLGTALGLAKKLFGLLKGMLERRSGGEGLGEVGKKLALGLGGLFLLVCAGKSLSALHRAKRKVARAKKHVRQVKKHRAARRSRKANGKNTEKKSLVKRIVRKALLG